MAEMEVSRSDPKTRIVMLPYMAHGHFNPFMALARKLIQRGNCTITIVNTPANILKLKSSFPNESETNISFAEIPFNFHTYDKNIPENIDNTLQLPQELQASFFDASEHLEAPFRKLMTEIPPECIISDMFFGWTVKIARELGIFHSVFIAGSGYGMGIYFSLSLNLSQTGDGEEFSLADFPEVKRLHRSQLGIDLIHEGEMIRYFRYRERQFPLCFKTDAILLNSVEVIERKWAAYFSRKTEGKPVYMIGPAFSVPMQELSGRFSTWLDLHPPRSVLYVSFGSQFSILPLQMRELAKGLEESGVPFIWVIRPPVGFSVTGEFNPEWLPEGFEERIKERNQGILVHKWAPQVEILSHESTGGFLSHCGWNSVMESLSKGVPIIGWPLMADQSFNSQMLVEELGVCVELARGIESAIIESNNVARTVKRVMGREGEEMRRKAREIQQQMESADREEDGFTGSSVSAMDEFLSSVISTT